MLVLVSALLLLVWVAGEARGARSSMRLKRADHMWTTAPPPGHGLGRVRGNVVPMNGGYLTLGAYCACPPPSPPSPLPHVCFFFVCLSWWRPNELMAVAALVAVAAAGAVATLKIGSPAQELSVLVDTGSSNTAVPVRACSACGAGASLFSSTDDLGV